jgi:Flp pilus assembly protein TadB
MNEEQRVRGSMTKRAYFIYVSIVVLSAILITAALLMWRPIDINRAAVAAGFLLLHLVAAMRDYQRGRLRW